jgi:hypothetical protein
MYGKDETDGRRNSDFNIFPVDYKKALLPHFFQIDREYYHLADHASRGSLPLSNSSCIKSSAFRRAFEYTYVKASDASRGEEGTHKAKSCSPQPGTMRPTTE